MNEQELEQKLKDKGLTAPRLTPDLIDRKIVHYDYIDLPSGKGTLCEITLQNGFTVRGDSAVVSKENYDPTIGRDIAYQKARDKIWELEAYLLQENLHTNTEQAITRSFIKARALLPALASIPRSALLTEIRFAAANAMVVAAVAIQIREAINVESGANATVTYTGTGGDIVFTIWMHGVEVRTVAASPTPDGIILWDDYEASVSITVENLAATLTGGDDTDE